MAPYITESHIWGGDINVWGQGWHRDGVEARTRVENWKGVELRGQGTCKCANTLHK